MSAGVLILRPEPGASETADRARALGLSPAVAPLFTLRALDWEAPDPAGFDAVLLTSANAARHGGAGLASLAALPCYAVGEATAAAARGAGFPDVRIGASDGEALLAMMAADGVQRALHVCGRDHVALAHPEIALVRRTAYAAEPIRALPDGILADDPLVLLHSPRASALFAALAPLRAGIRLAAISRAAADAAGEGWRSVAVAPAPRDEALLELAAKLCQTAPVGSAGL